MAKSDTRILFKKLYRTNFGCWKFLWNQKTKEEKIQEILETCKSPYILAPMFQVNDLAFRLMCRKHILKICYTGMINSHLWEINRTDRPKMFETCKEDRPLIIQLNGNDEKELIDAAKDLEPFADAIDINLGCTQHIARRGQYGFYMVNTDEKRQNVIKIITKITNTISVPMTAKIRVFSDNENNVDVETTVEFAKKLESAGISLIAVHGRSKQLDKAGDVDVSIIKSIVSSVKIPVIGNGGIKSKSDADSMLYQTGAKAVMIGQALLNNPHLLETNDPDPVDLSYEYLEFNKEHPNSDFILIKRHIFCFFNQVLSKSPDISLKLKNVHTFEDLETFLNDYREAHKQE